MKVFALFWKISYSNIESSRSFDTKRIDRGCDYRPNERISIDMDARKRAEINIFRREIVALLLHEFGLGHKVTEPTNQICSTMGQSVMSIRTARYWLNRFRNRKYKLVDQRRSKVDIDLLEQLIKQDSRLTIRCSVEQLECPHTTVERHLDALGKSWKYGV